MEEQAAAAGITLWSVPLPSPCSNAEYEETMRAVIGRARQEGISHMAFGGLFLEDVREYRTHMLAGTPIEPIFPVWCDPLATPALARTMLREGVRAVLTCVDPKQLSEGFVGHFYDEALLADLPDTVDPCGERGEFHTFCFAGPMFSHEIKIETGDSVSRDGFRFIDVAPVRSGDSD